MHVQDISLTLVRQGRSLLAQVHQEDLEHGQEVPAVHGLNGLVGAIQAVGVHRGRLVRLSM